MFVMTEIEANYSKWIIKVERLKQWKAEKFKI